MGKLSKKDKTGL